MDEKSKQFTIYFTVTQQGYMHYTEEECAAILDYMDKNDASLADAISELVGNALSGYPEEYDDFCEWEYDYRIKE